ncbi:MAG: M48 family metallopeptidase [Rickettsiales bacterium]|jgi:predicted metal-dependent hydrolase|nr:M48 family metallopeptidase [Rickettsiales bacterium]
MKIKDGDILHVFGGPYKVVQSEIGGAPEFLDRRVRDKIKKNFLIRAREIMHSMPATMRPKRVAVRDTRSRWGSCSASGTISLSWRLSFAPPEIMRYVIIHECCHLEQMNHSRAFWSLVAQYFGPDCKAAKKWLAKNGRSLMTV